MKINRIVNVGAQQFRALANMASGLLVTRAIIQHLGYGTYANLGVMLATIGFAGTMANGFSGAAARYITQSLACGNIDETKEYLTSTVLAVLGIFVIISFPLFGTQRIWPGTFGELSIAIMGLFFCGTLLFSLAGVYGSVNFAKERLVYSACVFSLSRLLYALLVYVFLTRTSFGVWGVGISYIVSAIISFIGISTEAKKLLSCRIFSLRYSSLERVRQVISFVMWTMLVYFGLFCTRAGILIVSKNCIALDSDLVPVVLAFQICSIAGVLLMSLNVITSPRIYQSLAKQEYVTATRLVERHFFLTIVSASLGIMIFLFEGNGLLAAWLGDKIPDSIMFVTVPMLIGTSIGCLSISLNAFLSGAGYIRIYSIICVSEGILTLIGVFVLLTFYGATALKYIGWVIATVALIKTVYVLWRFRGIFQQSSMGKYIFYMMSLLLVIYVSYWFNKISGQIIYKNEHALILLRTVITSIPFWIYLNRFSKVYYFINRG